MPAGELAMRSEFLPSCRRSLARGAIVLMHHTGELLRSSRIDKHTIFNLPFFRPPERLRVIQLILPQTAAYPISMTTPSAKPCSKLHLRRRKRWRRWSMGRLLIHKSYGNFPSILADAHVAESKTPVREDLALLRNSPFIERARN
jgi:hypothetical protein